MSSPLDVKLVLPSGFSAGDLAAPDLSQSPQLALEQWASARDASGHVALAWGCVAGDASAWNADATEIAQGKLAEIASATAARMRDAPTPMHVTADAGFERALVADGGGARARTFVAFTRGRAHGCFASCVESGVDSGAACDALVGARLEGALVPAPPPGLALRSLSLAVHHPHGALAALGAVLALGAALAIATRPGKKRPFRA